MATRIPLPGNGAEALQRGVEQGTGMFNQLIGQGVNLGRMHQQGQQFEKSHALAEQQQARLNELQPFIIEQYKQQAALHPFIIDQYKQAAAMAPYERQLRVQQINNLISEQALRKFDQDMLQQYMNQYGGQTGGNAGQAMTQPTQQTQGPLTTPPQGFPQEVMGGGQNVTPPSLDQIKQGFGNKVHPMVAGRMKKTFGFDPNELTPEEKTQQRLAEHRQKKIIDKEVKGPEDFTKPTKAVITQQQNIVAAGNNLIKQLQHLKNVKSPNRVGFMTPGEKAAYKTEANKAADTLMATYKWLGIQSSLEMAKQMTTKEIGESDEQYQARLDGLIEEATSRIQNAEGILKNNKIESQNFEEANNNDPFGLRKI